MDDILRFRIYERRLWESQVDGDTYEASRGYVQNVNKVKHTFVGMPTLWSYEVKR